MSRIELNNGELRIDGTPRVLLCASVFPFRIPKTDWESRLHRVKEMRYDVVDVYMPWNFYELERDKWTFAGKQDIEEFLSLCQQMELFVIARPGPYICSEWDGGGLPTRLSLIHGLRLRQDEPLYLEEVERWFDVILPHLVPYQYDNGGPIIMLQIENELDFFDCEEPVSYLASLHEMCKRHDITIPLVACAGQGDIYRATGNLPGVHPAVNLYPSDDSPNIEYIAGYYASALAEQGDPLLVMETNRLHRTLKRLVVSGARLVGPYLQCSGWNEEYGTSVNNWGDLVAFMTHDYDFGGVIDPQGSFRQDVDDGLALVGVIKALGPRLAAARQSNPSALETSEIPCAALDLAGGGRLYSLTQLAKNSVNIDVSCEGDSLNVTVPPETTLLLVKDLPLGIGDARLLLTDSEMVEMTHAPKEAKIVFLNRGRVQVLISDLTFDRFACEGEVKVTRLADERIRITGGVGVARFFTEQENLTVEFVSFQSKSQELSRSESRVLTEIQAGRSSQTWIEIDETGKAKPLEIFGVMNGSGRYRLPFLPGGVRGLVLGAAADVIQVKLNGRNFDWWANGGNDYWFEFPPDMDSSGPLDVTMRIWGHSNFDDGRLPALKLGSLRGVNQVIAITDELEFSSCWRVRSVNESKVGRIFAPLCDIGAWMTAEYPQKVRYQRTITSAQSGLSVLHAPQSLARLDVYVNGDWCGEITPLAPTLVTGNLNEGDIIAIDVLKTWGEHVGQVTLLKGVELTGWTVEAQSTSELILDRERTSVQTESTPIVVTPDHPVWVNLPASEFLGSSGGTVLRLDGEGLLITAIIGNINLGRVWCGPIPGMTLKGGRGDLFVIPSEGAKDGVSLYLEASQASGGILKTITIGSPLDLE